MRGKVGREVFIPLTTGQLNYGFLALNPLKVLCAGFSNWHAREATQ